MYIYAMRTYIDIHFDTNLENDLWLFICIWLGTCINTLINRCRITLTHTYIPKHIQLDPAGWHAGAV